MLSLLRLERKQKNSSNTFRIRIFLFLSYSFRIETINTFIHSRSSFENHIRFQTKMGKVYMYPFSDQIKTVQKRYPMGRHIPYIAYIGEYTTPPPPGIVVMLENKLSEIREEKLRPRPKVELSWDKPNLASKVHEKFDVRLS